MDLFDNSNPTRVQPRSRFQRFTSRTNRGCCNSQGGNMIVSIAWVVSGLLSVLIPLIHRTVHKNKYRETYMNYYWQHEYEISQEQRQQNYEQYGNNYNYGGVYMYDGTAEREWIDVNNCKWYQPNCVSYYTNQQGEPMSNQGWYPSWFSGFTTTEEEREEMETNLEQPGSLKFVYVWQLMLFAVICCYGMSVIRRDRNPAGLIIALLVWTNFAFLSMWLMADGSIITEGEQVYRMGFYGQISVLIFMSNFWYLLHGLAFVIVFWLRASCWEEQRNEEDKEIVEQQQRALAAKQQLQQQTDCSGDSGYNAPVTQQ